MYIPRTHERPRRFWCKELPREPYCSNAGHIQVTVNEAGQVSGLLGYSDLVCQRGDLEGDSFPDREPVQFLQYYMNDVFITTTANY